MCIFCRIINHEIPCYTLYEDRDVIAFLDVSQVTKGHTLVLPKEHVENLLECDELTLQKVMTIVSKLGSHIKEKTGAEGMNFLSNLNEVAGQSVPHFHMHIIPRYSSQDACSITFSKSEEQDMESLKDLLII